MDQHAADLMIDLPDEAAQAAALFRAEVIRVQQSRLAAGLSYSMLDGSGTVVHVHPDGRVDTTR